MRRAFATLFLMVALILTAVSPGTALGLAAPAASRGHGESIHLKQRVVARNVPPPPAARGRPKQAKPFLRAPVLQPSVPNGGTPAVPLKSVPLQLRKAGSSGSASAQTGAGAQAITSQPTTSSTGVSSQAMMSTEQGSASAPQGAGAPQAAASNATIERLTKFTGESEGNKIPPDTQVAVGPTKVIEMVNVTAQITDLDGGNASTFDLATFYGSTAGKGTGTDPRVIYDQGSGRFLSVFELLPTGGDEIDLAISQTSDPSGSWSIYTVASNTSNDLFDQPKLGFSNDKVTVSWNTYDSSGTFIQVETHVILKQGLLNGDNSVPDQTFTDSGKFQVVPAVTLGSTNTQYAMYHLEGATSVVVLQYTGVPGNNSVVNESSNSLDIGTADSPPLASQPSGGDANIQTNDGRMLSTSWQNDILWGVFNVKCTPTGDTTSRACQRYVRVSTSGGINLTENLDLGWLGGDIYFGAVAVDQGDDLFSGFTASSTSTYPTAVAIGVPGGNFPATTFGDFYDAGTQPYICNCVDSNGTHRLRWGDYSGIARDPTNPNDVWTAEEIGGIPVTVGAATNNNEWGTSIGRFTLMPPTVSSVSPNHAPELSAACAPTVTVGGTELVPGGTDVSFGSVAGSSVSVQSPGQLTVKAPAQARGTVDVTVTTADGTSPTSGADTFTYDPDTTPPVSSATASPAPLAANNGWTKGPVTVSISSGDGTCGSGVKSITYSASGAQSIASTTVPGSTASVTISNEGTTTLSYYATDNANNVEPAKSLVVKIDNSAPRVAFTTPPSGSPYLLNQPVAASYACVDQVGGVDGGVGVASCVGTVANGSNIATGSIGTYSFTVHTADKLGNATSESTTYQVTYRICLQYNPTLATSGRAYMFTVQICDANNVNDSTASIQLVATGVDGNPALAKSLGSLNPGNVFLYAPRTAPGASYTYNLDTRGLTSGSHVLNFTVQGDPVPHTAPFILR